MPFCIFQCITPTRRGLYSPSLRAGMKFITVASRQILESQLPFGIKRLAHTLRVFVTKTGVDTLIPGSVGMQNGRKAWPLLGDMVPRSRDLKMPVSRHGSVE